MNGDLAVDRLITRAWAPGATPLTWFVRSATGSDTNDGLTALTAFATLERGLREVALYATNKPSKLDVTDSTFNVNDLLQLGGTQLGGIRETSDAPAVPLYPRQRQTQIVATPVIALALTITSSAANLTTGTVTLTTSTAIAAGQLDNTILVGSVSGEYGAIADYTIGAGPNTIEVAADSTFTAPVRAYVPSATLIYGDVAEEADGAVYLNALSDWAFQWIAFQSHSKNSALTIWAHAPVSLFGCVLDGIQLLDGGSTVSLIACIVKDASYVQDGGSAALFRSRLTVVLDCNGSSDSGTNTCVETILDGCTGAWGGGNTDSRFDCELSKCIVRDGSSNGIEARFGNWAISSCQIANNAASGIFAINTKLQLQDVTGTGNGSFGLDMQYDAACLANGATVTGTGGDVNLGGTGGAGVHTWLVMPASDLPSLVMVRQVLT